MRRAAPPEGVQAWPLDLRRPEALARVLREARPEVVFHLAAEVDVSREPGRFPEAAQDLLLVSDRVARACLAQDLRLVAVGTCEEYGDGPAPFREDQAPRPVSPYSAAKVATAAWLSTLQRTAGLRHTWVRPFLTYGPGQRSGGLIPSACRAALTGQPFPMSAGTQTREVNYVEDIARGLVRCARGGLEGETLNLGGGPELPVRAIVERIFAIAGADPELIRIGALPARAGEASRFHGAHVRAQALLGHRPEVPLEEGLRRTLDWWRGQLDPGRTTLRDRLRIEEIVRHLDPRGALEKLLPQATPGEVYLVRAAPGQDRGHHLHPNMGEWFTAISGEGQLGVCDPATGEQAWLSLSGQRVYVPAGLAHALRPMGDAPWVVLALADRAYDPADVVPFHVPGGPGAAP